MKMCECAVKVNEMLVKEKECRLSMSTNLTTGEQKPILGFEAIAGKKKPKGFLIPSYCPFCGVKYEKSE